MLEQVKTAKEAGFSSRWLLQHFVSGPLMKQFATPPVPGLLATHAKC